MKTDAVPNPGSDEALAQGCTCPRMDNARGRGYMCLGDMFVIQDGCPVHCPRPVSFCEEQSDDR